MMTEGYLEKLSRTHNLDPKEVAQKWEAYKTTQSADSRAAWEGPDPEFGARMEMADFRLWVSQLAEKMGRVREHGN
jgi:hypothetical protein